MMKDQRLLASATAVSFLWTQVLWGAVSGDAFWRERREASSRRRDEAPISTEKRTQDLRLAWADLPPAASAPLAPSVAARIPALSPTIPASPKWTELLAQTQGHIQDVRISSDEDAPLVIQLQDVHAEATAQRGLAAILSDLDSRFDLTVVGLEGASGAFRLEPYREFPARSLRDTAARRLLDDGLIGGPEFWAITSERSPRLWGVERDGLYAANIQAFSRLADGAEAKAILSRVRAGAARRADQVFSPAMKAWDAAAERFQRGESRLTEYVAVLFDGTAPAASAYPALNAYARALALEKRLDFAAAESERRALLEVLTARLPEAALARLLADSLDHRLGRRSYGDFHSALRSLCDAHGVGLEGFPMFRRYVDYISLVERVPAQRILPELDALETAKLRAWAKSPEQLSAAERQRTLRLAEKLLSQSLTRREWDIYKRHAKTLPRLLADVPAGGDAAALDGILARYGKFYGLAERRDQVLVDNLFAKAAAMPRAPPSGRRPAMVLVAGGFHTDGIREALDRRNASWAVLAPPVAAGEVGTPAGLEFFRRGPGDLERIFVGEKLFLNTPRATAGRITPGFETLAPVTQRTFVSLTIALRFAGAGEASEPSAQELMRWVAQNVPSARQIDTWDEIREEDGILRVPLRIDDKRFEILLYPSGVRPAAGSHRLVHRGEIPGTDRSFEISEAAPSLEQKALRAVSAWRAGAPSVYGHQTWIPFLKRLDPRRTDHASVIKRVLDVALASTRAPPLRRSLKALTEALKHRPDSLDANSWWKPLAAQQLILPWRGMLADWPEAVWNDLGVIFSDKLALMPAEGVEKMTTMARKVGVAWNLKGVRFIRGPPESLPGLEADRFVTWTKDGFALVHLEVLKAWQKQNGDVFKSLFLSLLHENHEYGRYQHHTADGLVPEADDLERWHQEALQLGFHPDNPNSLSEILVALPGSAFQTRITPELLEQWHRRIEDVWSGKNPAVVEAFRDIVANDNADDDLLPLLAEFASTPGFDRIILGARDYLKREGHGSIGVLGELYHASRLKNLGYEVVALNVVMSKNLEATAAALLEIDMLVRKNGLFYFVEAHHGMNEARVGPLPASTESLRDIARVKLNKKKLEKFRTGVRTVRRIYGESKAEPTTRRRAKAPANTADFVKTYFNGNTGVAADFFEQITHSSAIPILLTITDIAGAAFTPEGETFEKEMAETITRRAQWTDVGFPVRLYVFPQHTLNRFPRSEGRIQVDPLRKQLRAARPPPAAVQPAAAPRVSDRRTDLAAARAIFSTLLTGNRKLYDEIEAAIRGRFATKRKINKKNVLVDEILPVSFLPFLHMRAAAVGAADLQAYGEDLHKNWHEKDLLVRTLQRSLRPTKDQTEFFYQRAAWGLEEFLPRLIAAKLAAGDYRLRLKSLGSSTGEEPYSLALAVREALENYYSAHKHSFPEFGLLEWIDRWDVQVDAYDVNLPNLYMTYQGIFDDIDSLPPQFADRFYITYDKFEAIEDLRRWVVPQYLDLNDADQLAAIGKGDTDVLFLLRTLFQPEAARRTAILEASMNSLAPGAPGMFVFTAGSVEEDVPVISLESDGVGGWAPSAQREKMAALWLKLLKTGAPLLKERAALALGVLADPDARDDVAAAAATAHGALRDAAQWALSRLPEEPVRTFAPGPEAVMDGRYALKRRFGEVVEKRRRDVERERDNWRKHKAILDKMLRAPATLPDRPGEAIERVEAIRAQQFRVEGARLRHETARRRLTEARGWLKRDMTMSSAWNLFRRLAVEPTPTQASALALAAKYLTVPPQNIFFIDPTHPMAEVAGRTWTAGEEGRMLGMHAVLNDGDAHGRFLFINAAETDLYTLVKTIVHEAWHLQGFPKVSLNLPAGLHTMLEEGITEMRAEKTMSNMLEDALAAPTPLHQELLASIEERYRELEEGGVSTTPLPPPAEQLDRLLNTTPYLDYETLVMDMVDAIGREPLTRLFEQGDTEFKSLLGDKFPALARLAEYLLLRPQAALRLFAGFALQQILKGDAPRARLAGWETVLGVLGSVETYVEWADGGTEGNPWGDDETFAAELVQAVRRFQDAVYSDGRLEAWSQSVRAQVETGGAVELSEAVRGEMRTAFLKVLIDVQSERHADPRRALSPREAEAFIPDDGVMVLQDPRRKLSGDDARRMAREGSLRAFLDRGAVVWVPAALGRKTPRLGPADWLGKLDARLGGIAANYSGEDVEETDSRAEAVARIGHLREWMREAFGRFEAAGDDVGRYGMFLTEVLDRLQESYGAVHDDEEVSGVIRDYAVGLAGRIDPEFGQAVRRLIKRLEDIDTKSGERLINEAVHDINARFLLPNGFYLDAYVQDDEFLAAPYRLAAAPLSVRLIPRTPPYSFYIVRAMRGPGRGTDVGDDMLAFRDEPKRIIVMFEDRIAEEMGNILKDVSGEQDVRFFSGEESWNDFLGAVRAMTGISEEDRRFWEGLRHNGEVLGLIRLAHAKDVAPDTPLAELTAKGRLVTALHEFRHFYDDVKKRFAHLRGDRLRNEKYIAVETSAYLAQIALSPMPFESLVFPFTRLLMPDRKAFANNRAIGAAIFELLLDRRVDGPRDAVAAFRELLSWDAAALQARARAAYEDRFGPLEENGYTLENVRGLLREAERSNYVDPLNLVTTRYYMAGFAATGALAILTAFLSPLWLAALPGAAALFSLWSALVLRWTHDVGLRVREKGARPLAKDRREQWEFQLGLSVGGPVKLLSTEDMARMSGSPSVVAFVRPEEPETVYLNQGWAVDPWNKMQQFILPIVLAHEGVHRFGPRLAAFHSRSPLSAWLNRFLVYPINQNVLSLPVFRSEPVAYFVMAARRLAPFRRFPFFEEHGGRLSYHFDKHDAPAMTRRAVRNALRDADLVVFEIPHEWVPYYQAVSNAALTPSKAMELMEEESAYTSYFRSSLHVTLTELYGRRVRVEGDAPLPESVHRKQQSAGDALNRSLSRFLDGDLAGALALFGQHASAMAEYEGLRNDLLRRRLKAVRQLAPQAKVGVVRGIVHSAHYANIRENLPGPMKDIVPTGSLPAGYTYLPYEKLLHALLRSGPMHPLERDTLTRQAFFSALMSLDYDLSQKQDLAVYSRRMNALAARVEPEQLNLLTEHVARQYKQDVIDNAAVPTSQVTARAEQWIQGRLPAVMSGFMDENGWLLSEERGALHSLRPDTGARRLKRRVKSFFGAARPYAGFALAGGIALGELISPWLTAAAALTRRQFLKGGATALAAAWLSGCLSTLSATTLDVRKVSPPVTQADKDLVARFEKLNLAYQTEMGNAVLRPEGFALRAELLEETRFMLENMSALENFVAGAFQRTMQIADFFTFAAQVDEDAARPSFETLLPALIALVPKSVSRKDVTLPRLVGRVAGSLFNTGSAAPDDVTDATWALLGRNEVFALALTYVVKHHVWKRLFEDAPGASPFEASLRRMVGGEWISLLRRAEQPLISIESGRASLDDIAAELEAIQKEVESLDPEDHQLSRLLYQRSMARLALAEFLRDREVVTPNRRAELREHMLNLTVFAYKHVFMAATHSDSAIVVHPRDTFLTGAAFLHMELARVAHEARHQINDFNDIAGHLSITVEGKAIMLPVSAKRHDDLLKQVKEAQTVLSEDNQLLGAALEGGKTFRTVLGGDTAANRASLIKDAFRGKGSSGLAQRMVKRFGRRRTIELNPSQTVRAVDALQPRLEHVLIGIGAARKVSTPEEAEKLYFQAWREGLEMFKDYTVRDWKEFFDNFLTKAPSLWPYHQNTYAIGAKVYGMIYYWTQGDREAEQKFINAISSMPENSGLNVPKEDVFREAFRRYNRLTQSPGTTPRISVDDGNAAHPRRWVRPLAMRAMIHRISGEWLDRLSDMPTWKKRLWQVRLALRAVIVYRGIPAFLNYWRKQLYGILKLPLGKGFVTVTFKDGRVWRFALWPFVLAGFLLAFGPGLQAVDLFLRYYALPLQFLAGAFALLVVGFALMSGREVTITRGETTTHLIGLLHALAWPVAAWVILAVQGPSLAAVASMAYYVLTLKGLHLALGGVVAYFKLRADRASGRLDYARVGGRYIVVNADDTTVFSGHPAFSSLPPRTRRAIIIEHELIHQMSELGLIPLHRVQNFVLANALTLQCAGKTPATIEKLFLRHMKFGVFPENAGSSIGQGSMDGAQQAIATAALREADPGRALARLLSDLPKDDPLARDVRRFLDAWKSSKLTEWATASWEHTFPVHFLAAHYAARAGSPAEIADRIKRDLAAPLLLPHETAAGKRDFATAVSEAENALEHGDADEVVDAAARLKPLLRDGPDDSVQASRRIISTLEERAWQAFDEDQPNFERLSRVFLDLWPSAWAESMERQVRFLTDELDGEGAKALARVFAHLALLGPDAIPGRNKNVLFESTEEHLYDEEADVRAAARRALAALDRARLLEGIRDAAGPAESVEDLGFVVEHLAALVATAVAAERDVWSEIYGTLAWVSETPGEAKPAQIKRLKRLLPKVAAAAGVEDEDLEGPSIEGVMAWAPLLEAWAGRLVEQPEAAGRRLWTSMTKALGLVDVPAGNMTALADALRAQGRAFLLPYRLAAKLLEAVLGDQALVPASKNPFRPEFRRALKILKDAYGLVIPQGRLHFIRGPPALKPTWTPDGHYLLPERTLLSWRAQGMDVVKALVQTLLHEEYERLGAAAGADRVRLRALHEKALGHFDIAPQKTARVIDLSELDGGPHFESKAGERDYINPTEANEVAATLRELLSAGHSTQDIVIASPYGAQLTLIRKTLARERLPVPDLKYLSRFPARDPRKIVMISTVRSTAGALEGLRHMPKDHLVRWLYHAAKTEHPDKPRLVFRRGKPLRVWQSKRGDYYIRTNVWNRPGDNVRTLRVDRFALLDNLEILKGRAGWKKLTREELAALSAPYGVAAADFAGLDVALAAGPRPILIGNIPTLRSNPEVNRALAPLLDAYEPTPERQKLRDVLRRVKEARERGETPVSVLDLDDTVFETRPRTLAILHDFARTGAPEVIRDGLLRLTEADIPWYWNDVAEMLKRRFELGEAAIQELARRYFSAEYLSSDRPMPGVARFIQEMHAAGAHIVFLSGRMESPDMRRRTIDALRRAGVPNPEEDARVSLWLRGPEFFANDPFGFAFKAAQVEALAALGVVVAAFDDLGPNVETFRKRFPAAAVFHLMRHDAEPTEEPPQWTLPGDYRLTRSLPYPTGPPLTDVDLPALFPEGDFAGAVQAFHNLVPDSPLTRIVQARGPPANAEDLDDFVRADASGAVFIPAALFEEWKRRDLDPHSLVFIALLQKDFMYRRYREAVAAGRPPTEGDVAGWRQEAEARGLSLDGPAALISLPILVQMYHERGTLEVSLPSDEEVHALLAELASRHAPTAAHSGRVGMLAARIGRSLGYSEAQVRFLKMAGLLHDIGKTTVEEKYPGLLNGSDPHPSEEVIKKFQSHAKAGWDILTERFPKSQIRLATLHHRRFDGGGYPDLSGLGLRTDLKGHDLPVVAEIVAAADAFDAQVSKRSYNIPVDEHVAIERMRKNTGHFDPLFLDALARTVEGPKAPPAPAFSFDLPGLRWDPAVMEAALAGAGEELRTKKTLLVDEVTAKLSVLVAGGKRVVAVGDLHGDLQGLLVDLMAAGLVDAAGRWSGGADVLVQMGDIIDRGPYSIETYLYLRGLQQQARAKGGDVVILLGNHELMLLQDEWSQISRNPDYNVNRVGAYVALKKDLASAIRDGHVQAAYEAGGHVFVHSGVRPMFAIGMERPAEFVAHVNQRLVKAAVAKDFVDDVAFFGDIGIFWVETEDLEKKGVPFPVVIGHKSTPHGRIDTLVGGNVVRVDVNHLRGGRGYLVLEKNERRAYAVEPEAPAGQGPGLAAAPAVVLPWDFDVPEIVAIAAGLYILYRLTRLIAEALRARREAITERLRDLAARAAELTRSVFRRPRLSRRQLVWALAVSFLLGLTGYKLAPLPRLSSIGLPSLTDLAYFAKAPTAPADTLVSNSFAWFDRVQNDPAGQMNYFQLRDEIIDGLARGMTQGKKPVLALGETHGQYSEYRFAAELMRDVGARIPISDYLEEEGGNRAHLFLSPANPYAGAIRDLGARVTFVTGNGPARTTFAAPLANATQGLTVVYAGANHIAPVIDWAPVIYNTHGDNRVPHPTVHSMLGANRPGAAVVMLQQSHVGAHTQEYFLEGLWSRRRTMSAEEITRALDRFLMEWDLRHARPAAEPVIVKADGIYYVILPDAFGAREPHAVLLFKKLWADPAIRAELLSGKFDSIVATDGAGQFNNMPWLVKRHGGTYIPMGRSVTFESPAHRTTMIDIDGGRSMPLRFDHHGPRDAVATIEEPSDPRAARLLYEGSFHRDRQNKPESTGALTPQWLQNIALVEAGLRDGTSAALRTGADAEAYFTWLSDAHPRTALEYAPGYIAQSWGPGVLRRAAERAAKSDLWAALNYAPLYVSEPWGPAVLKAAAENAAERDAWSAIGLSERYAGHPWGAQVLERAVMNEARRPARLMNGYVLETPVLIYFEHFNERPYAQAALESLDVAYSAEVLKHGGALQGYHWSAEVFRRAVSDAIARDPLYAFTAKRLYIGVPGGPGLFRRAAEAALAQDVSFILANWPILADQAWGEQIFEQAAARADTFLALLYFDRYQDRPYAERLFAEAVRRDPAKAAETAVRYILSQDPALARKILEAVLPLAPQAVSTQASALGGQPWGADLLKRAKKAEKARPPQKAGLGFGMLGVWLASLRRFGRGRDDGSDLLRLRYGDAQEYVEGLHDIVRQVENESGSIGAEAAVDVVGLAHALENALTADPAKAGAELGQVLSRFYEAGFEVIPAVDPNALDQVDPRSLGLRGSEGGALSGARLAAIFAGQSRPGKASLKAGEAGRIEGSYRRGWLRGRWIEEGRRALDRTGMEEALRAVRADAPARDTVRTFDVSGLAAALKSGGTLSARHAKLLRTLEEELRRGAEEASPVALVSDQGAEGELLGLVTENLPEDVRGAARERVLVLTGGKARSWFDGLLDPDRVLRSLERRLGRPVRTEIFTDDARRWKADWRSEAKALLIEILNDAEFRVFRSLKDVERDLRNVQLLKIQA